MNVGTDRAGMSLVGDRQATVIGFAAALGVLAVTFWVIGVDQMVATISRADVSVVALMVPVALGWLFCWGLALRLVLSSMEVEIGVGQSFLTFSAAVFANNVTPFGQAGGEPVTAYVISRSSDAKYETGLAAIASVDALHFVPTIGFAGVGLAYFATRITFGRQLVLATVAVGALAVAVPVLAYLGWRYREGVESAVVKILAPVVRTVGRLLPGRTAPDAAVVRERVQSFFGALDRVGSDRYRLGIAMSLSALGWLGIMTSLWLGLYALGNPVGFAVVLVAIPVSSIAGVTPLPGGLGALDGVLIALLVTLSGVPAATAGAAVVLHRAATYWLPVVVGGSAAGMLTAKGRRTAGAD